MSFPVSVFNPTPGVQLPPSVLKTVFASSERPLVVKNQLQPWMEQQTWKAEYICNKLGQKGETTTYKVCPKTGTKSWRKLFGDNIKEVIFETQCEYVEAKYTDFVEWLTLPSNELQSELPAKKRKESDDNPCLGSFATSSPVSSRQANPLLEFSKSEFWIYADYKYMRQVFKDYPDFLSIVNWSLLGFEGRDGKDSTIWIGSEGSYTPCHYDTYGYNIVAQLSGEKKWTFFSPSDSERLYPTRVPYEESSVFSSVNIRNPDLVKHPLFASATRFTITLQEGDVLYVPKHWWHYVESVSAEPTVSVNTWIEQDTFPHERIKEAITRTLVSQFSENLMDISLIPDWINPNEELFSTGENMRLLTQMLHEKKCQHTRATADRTSIQPCSLELSGDHRSSDGDKDRNVCSCMVRVRTQDFVKAITSDHVVSLIADILLNQT